MKERPIIFSGPLVLAALAGRKTQTRRVVKPQPIRHRIGSTPWWWEKTAQSTVIAESEEQLLQRMSRFCPYGKPGDRLWVREAFHQHYLPDNSPLGGRPCYRADQTCQTAHFGWKPSIHMPRWASRILLEITEVRVERVQEINEEDAIAEAACEALENDFATVHLSAYPRGMFRFLWTRLNAKRGYSWQANPWVWVISFKLAQELGGKL